MTRVLFLVVVGIPLSACRTGGPTRTLTRIALHDGRTPIDTDEGGMLPRDVCGKLCPPYGERSASSCSPAELVTDHPEERIVVCKDDRPPRPFRFQELPSDVSESDPSFQGPTCIRICGAHYTGVCQLLPKIPIVEGKRFVVCRYSG